LVSQEKYYYINSRIRKMANYPWYEDVNGEAELEQGEIITDCSVILPNNEHYQNIINNIENNLPLDIIQFNGIILSQSCDIVNNKINSIIVCPVISLMDLMNKEPYFRSKDARESLRQGREPSYHLLNKFCIETGQDDFYAVSFRHIYSIPKEFIKAVISNKKRIRLLPPYREHLSQSFARYFMRVGLPTDIPQEEIKKYMK